MPLQGVFGLLAFIFLAWLISENRREVRLKTILAGVGLQLVLAFLLLKSQKYCGL